MRLIFIILCIIPALSLEAQISPGKLSNAHAEYEGTLNCTLCHDLGKKVSNTKCLDCHDILRDRIDLQLGYHASSEVKGKDCFECHSEHHGREFDMVRFDEENFDHLWTGYELTGEHLKIDCRECHQPDFITNEEIRTIEGTFLGLSTDCIDCHEDVHQTTLGSDCAACHSTKAFAPAEYFEHDQTNFALVGAHIEVDCIECHAVETRNGEDFQVFAGIPFNDCIACHEDVHQGNLKGTCQSCHNEWAFDNHQTLSRYNHNLTNFPLKGAHNKISCAACHDLNLSPTQLFQTELGIDVNDCIACHEDVHDGKFGTNCVECHNEQSFVGSFNEESFNHSLTSFPLEGKHNGVDCKACHTNNLIDPLPFQKCTDCHEDFHDGIFVDATFRIQDCADCHIVQGFEEVNYTVEQHNQTDFALTGAHLATPCLFCHIPEGSDEWVFRNIGETCVDCHDNVHQNEIDAQFFPNEDCTVCHTTDNWRESNFDHSLTAFNLEGQHQQVDCRECHLDEDTNTRIFAGTSTNCLSCHEDIHQGQFLDSNGWVDCASCHAFDDWSAPYFNHDNAAFQLDGSHATVACESCHLPVTENGITYILYKNNQFECIDCHK